MRVRLLQLSIARLDENLTIKPVVGNTQLTDHAVMTQIWQSAKSKELKSPLVVTTKTETTPGPTCQTASANLTHRCCEVHECIISRNFWCDLCPIIVLCSWSHSDDMH